MAQKLLKVSRLISHCHENLEKNGNSPTDASETTQFHCSLCFARFPLANHGSSLADLFNSEA